jgi:hypothetical protein
MANGKLHDNPVTDLVIHGHQAFPPEIASLVLKLHALAPYIFNALGQAPFDWAAGKHHGYAIKLLNRLIEAHGNPVEMQKHIAEYRKAAADL